PRRRPPASTPLPYTPLFRSEKDSHAVYFLTQQDVTRLDVVNYLSHGIAKLGDESEPGAVSPDGEGRAEGGEGEGKADALTEYATDRKSTRLNSSHVKSSYAV